MTLIETILKSDTLAEADLMDYDERTDEELDALEEEGY